jgi:ADP-ribose pyrophosphatase YjhB (NUDIX family)
VDLAWRGVEHGEDPADAVLRELTEETGYTDRLVRLLGMSARPAKRCRNVSHDVAAGT